MIDENGYRPNVGMVILNQHSQVLWARRISPVGSWQFPQGGISEGETPTQAMYRELKEEVGLDPQDVEVLSQTEEWLHYDLPKKFIRTNQKPVCIGQKQKWFLLKLLSDDSSISLDENPKPEFEEWQWVSYWYPLNEVVEFKRGVYTLALKQLAPSVPSLN